MKKIICLLILSALVFGFGIQATPLDPELAKYLDKNFVATKRVFIASGYRDNFFTYGWETEETSGTCWFDATLTFFQYLCKYHFGITDTTTLANLNDQALEVYDDAYNAIPTLDWSFVIDADSLQVVHAFHATDYATTTTDGAYTANDAIASYGGDYHSYNWSFMHQYMTGYPIEITDQNGETYRYQVENAVNYSPIILDLDNDGQPCVNRKIWSQHAPAFFSERTAKFDMSGDGKEEFIEWLGTKDGLLVLPEADGSVKNACNLFGTAGGYEDGYQKMAIVLDLDRNGWVEGDELNGLYIWTDINGNARADKGEMKPIQEYGVEKISVAHNNYESICVIKGKQVKTWDWWPCGYELMRVKK